MSPPNDLRVDDDPERLICFCHAVSYARLKQAIESGSDTIEKIQSETCASTGCGGCEFEVKEILQDLLSKK